MFFFLCPPSIHILPEIFTSISGELGGPGAAPSCPGAPQVAGGSLHAAPRHPFLLSPHLLPASSSPPKIWVAAPLGSRPDQATPNIDLGQNSAELGSLENWDSKLLTR